MAKWHFLYLYGYVLNNNYAEELPTLFKKIANGSIFTRTDNFIEKWFSRIHKLVTKCLEQNYEQSAERDKNTMQGFNFKNWLRSTSEFQKLKKEIKYIELSDYPL